MPPRSTRCGVAMVDGVPAIPPSPPPIVSFPPSPPATSPAHATPTPGVTPATPEPSGSVTPTAAPTTLALAKTRIELNVGAASGPIAVLDAAPPLRATLSAPVADVRIDPATSTLVIRGVTNGTAMLTVSDGTGATATASVLVGPNAGFSPSDVNVTLTGTPTNAFATAKIQAALLRAVAPLPGAILVPGSVQLPDTLSPGQRVDAPLRFHVSGIDRYVDVDGVANVHVAVVAPLSVPPTVLFYSDDPEEVTQDGLLFRGTVSRASPARLYYYHQTKLANESIDIVLQSASGAGVSVLGRGAGPNPQIFYVGQSASYQFLDDLSRNAAVVLDVPVGAPLVLPTSVTPMKNGDLVAGVLEMTVLNGGPVTLSVVAVSPGADLTTLLSGDDLLSDGKNRRGAYDISQTFSLDLSYAVGGPEPQPVEVGSGEPPIANLQAGGRPLAGDYGILRNLGLQLSNPTRAPATIYLYEQPIGYPVTTTIDFNGDPAPTRLMCVKQPTRYLVRAFNVPATSTETVTGTYTTDGGSTYPLDFGLTSTPPSPLPVSMLAPNGCFPKPPGATPSPSPPMPSPSPPTPSPSPAQF